VKAISMYSVCVMVLTAVNLIPGGSARSQDTQVLGKPENDMKDKGPGHLPVTEPGGTVEEVVPKLILRICNSQEPRLKNWIGYQRQLELDGVDPCVDPDKAIKTKDTVSQVLKLPRKGPPGTVQDDIQKLATEFGSE
jgi:hypothetical protein